MAFLRWLAAGAGFGEVGVCLPCRETGGCAVVGDGVGMIRSGRPGKGRFVGPSEAGVTASLSANVCGHLLVVAVCAGGGRVERRLAVAA
jgi:hypothetical protein